MAFARVSTAEQLLDAVTSGVSDIGVDGSITGMPMITLQPRMSLRGGNAGLRFPGCPADRRQHPRRRHRPQPRQRGRDLQRHQRRRLRNAHLARYPHRGQVLLTARDAVRAGHVTIDDLTITSADVRGRAGRPRRP